MSATNRSAVRHADDYYATPAWATEALLARVSLPPLLREPGCGSLAIASVLAEAGHHVVGCDIVRRWADCPAGVEARVGDYLTSEPIGGGAVVMNPPFRQAADFARRALSLADGAPVCALLRLGFLGSSKTRLDLVGPGSPLAQVIVLARRPSFTGDGRTDAVSYAWFVWREGFNGPASIEVAPP